MSGVSSPLSGPDNTSSMASLHLGHSPASFITHPLMPQIQVCASISPPRFRHHCSSWIRSGWQRSTGAGCFAGRWRKRRVTLAGILRSSRSAITRSSRGKTPIDTPPKPRALPNRNSLRLSDHLVAKVLRREVSLVLPNDGMQHGRQVEALEERHLSERLENGPPERLG